MNYVLHYDIAALVICLTVLFHHFTRRRVKTKVTKIFLILIYLQMLSGTLDIVTSLMIDRVLQVSLPWMYFWNIVYLLSFNIVTPVFICYLIHITRGNAQWSVRDYILVWVPYMVDVMLIVSSPITHGAFYIDENLNYGHNWSFYIVYGISIIYLMVAIWRVHKYRYNIKRYHRVMVYFYIVATILSVVVQMIMPDILIIHFAVSVSFFLVYLSLENPDSYIDSSVGVFNREGYILTLRGEVDSKNKFRLIGVYLSGLRYLNETIGVENKKALIGEITNFLASLNGRDKVFRLSNTKFVVLAEDDDELEQSIVDSITERFVTPFEVNNTDVPLEPALAILRYPEDADNLDNIMDLLDYSMNELMENTERTVIYAGEDVVSKRHREGRILQIMTKAIHDKDFEMFYQPIYSVEHKRYDSAEALLRLKNSDIGYISPEEFIPIAEKNGMILEIGEFVFENVCQFIMKNKVWKHGIDHIHINLSVVQCMQDDLAEKFLDVMREVDLPPHRIKLEVTETAAVVSSTSLSMNMNALHEAGIMFALDDYGTGFSNAISLIEYPYNTIKIDKSVVWAAMENENAKKVLGHTVAMLKSLNMSIVAEGVESYEQSEELIAMGCDYLQGYYYSKPISGEDFLELVSLL